MPVPTLTPVPQWVSGPQIPMVFGISTRAVTDAIRDGEPIDRRYVGKKPLYSVESINRWINEQPEDLPTA